MTRKLTKSEIQEAIRYHGGREEFHQKRKEFYMYDYHKRERKKYEKMYKDLKKEEVPEG